jgi:hypothetical protein
MALVVMRSLESAQPLTATAVKIKTGAIKASVEKRGRPVRGALRSRLAIF